MEYYNIRNRDMGRNDVWDMSRDDVWDMSSDDVCDLGSAVCYSEMEFWFYM
jgi:hypothetical protein